MPPENFSYFGPFPERYEAALTRPRERGPFSLRIPTSGVVGEFRGPLVLALAKRSDPREKLRVMTSRANFATRWKVQRSVSRNSSETIDVAGKGKECEERAAIVLRRLDKFTQ